jgi:hypothetical protein
MTAPAQETMAADFDLVIGDLEVQVPTLDETAATLTDLHTANGCSVCTCKSIYCF